MAVDGAAEARRLLEQMARNYATTDLPELIDGIEGCVLALDTAAAESSFQNLLRRVHSLKGTAGTYGFRVVTATCHELEEEALRRWQGPDTGSAVKDSVVDYVDLLRDCGTAIVDDDRAAMDAITSRLSAVRGGQVRRRCLVVERSQTIRETCLHVAHAAGYEVVVVPDAYVALGRVIDQRFEVLVNGVETGALTGPGLIAAIRLGTDRQRDLRTILVTSNESQRGALKAETIDAIITKGPKLVAELAEALAAPAANNGADSSQKAAG